MPHIKIVKHHHFTAYYKPKHDIYRVYATDQTEDREICTFHMENVHVSFKTYEALTIVELVMIGELFNIIRNLKNS